MRAAFDGFETRAIETRDGPIHMRVGGAGAGLLLLHGFPQTGAMWAGIAPALAARFTVVVPDLRGYGASFKPADRPEHAQMSKRAMAGDMVAAMAALGFERFAVIGHDRGARVAHRLCLDHPGRVSRAGVLDIAPTRTVFERLDAFVATAYYHWFLLSQPAPFPERMIGADPDFFLESCLGGWGSGLDAFDRAALDAYRAAWRDPAAIHAACEDYRAAAGIDLTHDRADETARIECPLLVLTGANGVVAKAYDIAAVWREKARDVTARTIPGGHFFPEESPEATLAALDAFLR